MATSYLARHQNDDGSFPGFSPLGTTADAVQALVAARRGPGAIADAVAFVEGPAIDSATLGQKAKVVMALVAAGRDPRSVAGHHDLIAEIRSTQQSDGRFAVAEGDFSGQVQSHALAMLALAAAGEDPGASAAQWLAAAQCDDGGWQYDQPAGPNDDAHCFDSTAVDPGDFARTDTNTTSYAVQAFAASPTAVELGADPFAFFASARDELRGGYVYDPFLKCIGEARPPDCFVTDANSTGLVIQAHDALGISIPAGAVHALEHLQYATCGKLAGAFAFTWTYSDGSSGSKWKRDPAASAAREGGASNVGATVDGSLGLLRTHQPVQPVDVTRGVPRPPAC